jgi:tRNA threonylcarbamoyl adenosine modification protein YjeE
MTQNLDPTLVKWLSQSQETFALTADRNALGPVAKSVKLELVKERPFCLWMVGGLGAGKTTFAGEVLRSLGLDPDFPVTSPTFTYLNEYQINHLWYAHIDLYRATAGFSLEELGFVDSRDFAGYLIEWPAAVDETTDVLPPTHLLQIEMGKKTEERVFKLNKIHPK